MWNGKSAVLLCVGTLLGTSPASLAQEVIPPPADTADAAGAADATGGTTVSLAARFDCLHDFSRDRGSEQECLTLSGFRLGIQHQANATVWARLRIDPFASPVGGSEETSRRGDLPGSEATELGIIDDYAIVWGPRPNLEIAVEAYRGAATLPSVSGLTLGNSLALSGWRQSALSATYALPALPDMRVKFAVGNGEGETVRNLDPQQYFGFELGATVYKGVHVRLGASLDGNSVGSEEYAYQNQRYKEACQFDPSVSQAKRGYSTQRLAAGIVLDGTLPAVAGLKAALGWQRNVMSDLDKHSRSAPSVEDFHASSGCRIDPGSVFVEATDASAVNTVQQTTYAVNLNYRFMTNYFVAVDYTTRRIDTGSVKLFRQCDAYVGNVCTVPSTNATNQLGEAALTLGAGMDLAPALRLTLEYHEASYDKKYAQVYYDAPDGKTSDSLELFNVRLAYNWL